MIKANIVIGDVVLVVASCYCPQAGRPVNEKEELYELTAMVMASEKVLVDGDFNGHVGSATGSFGEVNGGFAIGKINDGRIRLLNC